MNARKGKDIMRSNLTLLALVTVAGFCGWLVGRQSVPAPAGPRADEVNAPDRGIRREPCKCAKCPPARLLPSPPPPPCNSLTWDHVWRPSPLVNPVFRRQRDFERAADWKELSHHDISTAAHISADRIRALTQMCTYWKGPVAASVYVNPGEEALVTSWCTADTACNCGKSGGRITLHVVHADKLSQQSKSLYPVNTLRNEALVAVKSKLVLGLDADFVMGGSWADLPVPESGVVYVLPCFRVKEPLAADMQAAAAAGTQAWPLTKEALLKWKAEGNIMAYGEDDDWPYGHMDVDYARWYTASESFEITKPNIYFEPYFIARMDDVTMFDERYRGYGAGDKALQFHLLFQAGVKAYVLPNHFVLHLPHKRNSWQAGNHPLQGMYNTYHGVDRMSYGVHQIAFWNRVVGNCVAGPCDRKPDCSTLTNPMTGRLSKCQTNPDKFKP